MGSNPSASTMKQEIYVSTDIEADGPIPGPHSMLSFGSAAFLKDERPIATFTANLHTLPGALPDPKTTTEFWDKQPKAWEECRKNLQDPKQAMLNYVAWLESLPGPPVFVGYPATFDFMFVYWYLVYFTGKSPFSFSGMDIKSYASAKLRTPFRETTKRRMPEEWFPEAKHSHIALEDAIEQGILFMRMRAAG